MGEIDTEQKSVTGDSDSTAVAQVTNNEDTPPHATPEEREEDNNELLIASEDPAEQNLIQEEQEMDTQEYEEMSSWIREEDSRSNYETEDKQSYAVEVQQQEIQRKISAMADTINGIQYSQPSTGHTESQQDEYHAATNHVHNLKEPPANTENYVRSQEIPLNPLLSNQVIDLVDDEDSRIRKALDSGENSSKRQKTEPSTSLDDAASRMRKPGLPVQPGAAIGRLNHNQPHIQERALPSSLPPIPQGKFNKPVYLELPAGFQPSWKNMAPNRVRSPSSRSHIPNEPKRYQLSLLNVNEFTITGLPLYFDSPPTSISGLRVPIRKISRDHGKAVYERDKEGGGKWRIPLGAYHAFEAYLSSLPNCRVDQIPEQQLKIASLERARQEKGYPSVEKLVKEGVPLGLAKALAPFQRGGVDFVVQKEGRALIADDMGLGKTIQAIASMSVYQREWPLLVLTPSSARYHWENEFRHWLGESSHVHKVDDETSKLHCELLQDSQIRVLTCAKDELLPDQNVKVVICSYGLAPTLVESGRIYPRLFRCAIVDESHMLKNKSTKRTSTLLPILNATDRCVLLSGTPALARPLELWPQLEILNTEKHGWWDNEADFIAKYVKTSGSQQRAELHTMLTGTVMIRRLKNDILKTLPKKRREKAEIHVLDDRQRNEFKRLILELRTSKGALGDIARKQHAENTKRPDEDDLPLPTDAKSTLAHRSTDDFRAAENAVRAQYDKRLSNALHTIRNGLAPFSHQMNEEQFRETWLELETKARADQDEWYHRQLQNVDRFFKESAKNSDPTENERTTLLSRLYSLTGEAKIPLIVDMLKRWLKDPTKGKLCIFAHHLSVLDAIQEESGLSHGADDGTEFIRIDGSTNPKVRQERINTFQSNPACKVALLGITAAGVAVTLTASSTVWFAELFWTPAIMIQAEDRCHRIGQQARVNCLYFAAKGTLDDVLWQLIEKKFQDLGEFVEGKEKMKIIVDKIYKSHKDLHSMFQIIDAPDEEDEDSDEPLDFTKEFQLDNEMCQDIALLGEEEQMMLHLSELNDDDDIEASGRPVEAQKKASIGMIEEAGIGKSENDAIDLVDDDDEECKARSRSIPVDDQPDQSKDDEKTPDPQGRLSDLKSCRDNETDPFALQRCRLYKILIPGSKIGIEMTWFHGRVVVLQKSQERIKECGADSRPAVGDVLAAVNGIPLPLARSFQEVMAYLRHSLNNKRGFSELVFAEDPVFTDYFILEHQKKIRSERQQTHESTLISQEPKDGNAAEGSADPTPNHVVIDLIDD